MKPIDALDIALDAAGDLGDPEHSREGWSDDGLDELEIAVNLLLRSGCLETSGHVLTRTDLGNELNSQSSRGRRKRFAEMLTSDEPPPTLWKADRIAFARSRDAVQRRHAEQRLEIVEGVTKAIAHMAKVDQLVRQSRDRAMAREALSQSELALSDLQAHHVLDLRVGQLTELARADLAEELDALRKRLAEPPLA